MPFTDLTVRPSREVVMLLVRVLGQFFGGSLDHPDGRVGHVCRARCPLVLLLILLAGLIVTTSLAHASPPDPTWIEGIYDAADYDDVVGLLTDANAAGEPGPPRAVESLPAVVRRVAACSAAPVSDIVGLLALRFRSPPTYAVPHPVLSQTCIENAPFRKET